MGVEAPMPPSRGILLCYVMVPLLPPVNCAEDSAGDCGFMRHLLSGRRDSRVSIVCAARQADFSSRAYFCRRWDHCVRMGSVSHTGTCPSEITGAITVTRRIIIYRHLSGVKLRIACALRASCASCIRGAECGRSFSRSSLIMYSKVYAYIEVTLLWHRYSRRAAPPRHIAYPRP
jgi:hypothetical protein